MKLFLPLLCLTLFISCSDNVNENKNCKYLVNIGVNVSINLSFPEYSELQFTGNSIYIPNAGNAGVIVAFTGADYLAWDAADPNHVQSPCSTLANSSLQATCACEDKNTYSLVTGQSLGKALPCGLKNYRVEKNGNTLLIYN